MSSLNHREIGARVRHAALTGESVHITIDHKTFKVFCEQVDGPVEDRLMLDLSQAAALADIKYKMGVYDGMRQAAKDAQP